MMTGKGIMERKMLVYELLSTIGDDPNRDGLVETPARVDRSFNEIFSGYSWEPDQILELMKFFPEQGKMDQIVLLQDIEFYSMCEHHMLPFYGKAAIAYIPMENEVIGVSKLARLLDVYARRLQVQERIGRSVTSTLMKTGRVRGASCIIDAVHLCMRMRGVGKQDSLMTTSSMEGAFFTDAKARNELMLLLRR